MTLEEAEKLVNQYQRLVLSVDEVSRGSGSKHGLCDCIDNDSVPYQSWLADELLQKARYDLSSSRQQARVNPAGD